MDRFDRIVEHPKSANSQARLRSAFIRNTETRRTLETHSALSLEAATQLIREVHTLALVRHENNFCVYDTYLQPTKKAGMLKMTLVTENVSTDLMSAIESHRSLRTHFSEGDLLSFAQQMCDGLLYAQSKGVPHGSFSARSVYFTEDGVVKIRGYCAGGCGDESSGAAGVIAASSADVFALGIVMLHAASLALPAYSAAQDVAESAKELKAAVKSIPYSRKLKKLISSLLRPDPQDRLDLEALQQALAAFSRVSDEEYDGAGSDSSSEGDSEELPDFSAEEHKAAELPCLCKHSLMFYDFQSGDWGPAIKLQREINYNRYTKYLSLASGQLCCVGGGGTLHSDLDATGGSLLKRPAWRSAILIFRTGGVRHLPRLQHGRAATSLAQYKLRLYAFGGLETVSNKWMKSCEGLNLQPVRGCEGLSLREWEQAPDMSERRGGFNPCVVGDAIYLCGGWTKALDVFFPCSNRIEQVPLRLPEATFALSYLRDDCIHVITIKFFCKFRVTPAGMELLDSAEHGKDYSPWTNATPVVVGNHVYSVKIRRCVQYPLELVRLDN